MDFKWMIPLDLLSPATHIMAPAVIQTDQSKCT